MQDNDNKHQEKGKLNKSIIINSDINTLTDCKTI